MKHDKIIVKGEANLKGGDISLSIHTQVIETPFIFPVIKLLDFIDKFNPKKV